eukprot:GHRR01032991.1.p1 GENE.GHRR01032991.1~~GHRR01032991.1.p1  ORF type:complete len:266 (+),score=55.51 GHRR01032991.1:320-1117(+)
MASWVVDEPTVGDMHGPSSDTGMPCHSPDCFGLCNRRPPVVIGKAMGPKAHVLVCAPSNAALDEVVLRILQHGLLDGSGKRYDPSIVRIGVTLHHSVKTVSLEMLVDAKLGVTEKGQVSGLQRERAKLTILQEAVIVASTLSFAGSSVFHRLTKHFDVVIIDEAAQAVEPSVLMPLAMGCKQVGAFSLVWSRTSFDCHDLKLPVVSTEQRNPSSGTHACIVRITPAHLPLYSFSPVGHQLMLCCPHMCRHMTKLSYTCKQQELDY